MAIAFTCSEDEDFGSLGDNTVIVTGGTSGTPAVFSDFVTADAAGEAVLLAAVSCAKGMTLSYQIRPTMAIALTISFIIASKTADTDYVFITGTDWDDQAQTESIDISAGDGTYTSTKKFRTITQIDIEDVGDGSGTAAADGTVRVTQPQWGFIWDYGGGQYLVGSHVDFGNGSDSTYFQSKLEMVYFADNIDFEIKAAATLEWGDLAGDYGIDGCMWSVSPSTSVYTINSATATLLWYNSHLHHRNANRMMFWTGVVTIKNGVYTNEARADTNYRSIQFRANLTLNVDYFFYANAQLINLSVTPVTFNNVHAHYTHYPVQGYASATIDKIKVSDQGDGRFVMNTGGSTLNIVDPIDAVVTPTIWNATDTIKEQYTCNIHVVDKDGTALQSVVVDCEDTDTSAVWTAGTITTDASGDITEQTITRRQWYGTSETLTTYSPHKFTISKAGYETLILENITVDAPINWHLELQPIRTRAMGRTQRGMAANFQ